MFGRRYLVLLAAAILVACSTQSPLESQTLIGFQQSQLIEEFGTPDETGESFWYSDTTKNLVS